jgi:glucose-1-phosphate thymidylyltransferase
MTRRETDKAVILARGLGTRMRKSGVATLDNNQRAVADTGVKALIPIDRPFLDYSLSGLADAGFARVCLVIGPEHDEIRDYYTRRAAVARLSISFAVQDEPLGTADAVAAAEAFADGDDFLVLNSDNYYPGEALRALCGVGGSAVALFDRDSMIAGSNVGAERINDFALAKISPDGLLARIIEKPDEQTVRSPGEPVYVSMNCWRFTPAIFDACRGISPSPRGELELPDAVEAAMAAGERFTAVTVKAAVLDLSYQSDIAAVGRLLAGVKVNL